MESPKERQFLKLVEDNKAVIFKIASLYTDAREDREDLMQEIAFQLWRSLDSFQQKSAPSTWLYRVGMNTAIYFLKKEKKHRHLALDKQVFQRTEEKDPEKAVQEKLMWQAIKNLSAVDKGIVLLYLEEKKHAEIARIMGISKSNVGTRLGRIKQKLQKDIQNLSQ